MFVQRRSSIRRLSTRAEFLIVIDSTFGVNFALFLVGIARQGIEPRINFNDAHLLSVRAATGAAS